MSNGHQLEEESAVPETNGPIFLEDARQREVREQADAARRQEARDQLTADSQRTQANSSEIIARLTFALLMVSLISGFISYLQFRAAKASADAAKESANVSLTAALTTIQQLRAAEEANWLNRANSISSEKQGRDALSASINASRTDQRAWVGVLGFGSVNVKEGSTDLITVVIGNSGKTPALGLKTNITGKTIPPGAPFTATFGPPTEHPSNSVIQPGAQSPITARAIVPLNKLNIQRLQDKSLMLYIYGKVQYRDVFGNPHFTHFCGTIDPATQGFTACDTYKEAN